MHQSQSTSIIIKMILRVINRQNGFVIYPLWIIQAKHSSVKWTVCHCNDPLLFYHYAKWCPYTIKVPGNYPEVRFLTCSWHLFCKKTKIIQERYLLKVITHPVGPSEVEFVYRKTIILSSGRINLENGLNAFFFVSRVIVAIKLEDENAVDLSCFCPKLCQWSNLIEFLQYHTIDPHEDIDKSFPNTHLRCRLTNILAKLAPCLCNIDLFFRLTNWNPTEHVPKIPIYDYSIYLYVRTFLVPPTPDSTKTPHKFFFFRRSNESDQIIY